MLTIAIPVYAFLLLPVLSVAKGETEDFLLRTAKIQWGLMLTVFCISHAPALLILNIPGYRTSYLLFFLVTVVQLSDVLQYVFGKLFGRHKIAPKVSPSKTVEGLRRRRPRRDRDRRRPVVDHAVHARWRRPAWRRRSSSPASSAAWCCRRSSARSAPRTGGR